MKNFTVLGLNYTGGHDSSAAIMRNGKIISAYEEERFNLEKHTGKFPYHAINHCLRDAKISKNKIDLVCLGFDQKKLIKDKYLKMSLKNDKYINVLVNDIHVIKNALRNQNEIDSFFGKKCNIKIFDHYDCHHASVYFPSGFKKSLLVSYDGKAEFCTSSVKIANKNKFINLGMEDEYPNSLGYIYAGITYYLGWKFFCDEGIVMGLASFGNPLAKIKGRSYIDIFREIIKIKKNNQIEINEEWISYHLVRNKWLSDKFYRLFGKKRNHNEKILPKHKNIAAALQLRLEEVVLQMLKKNKKKYKVENLCFSGGVALNCSLNGKIEESNLFKKVNISPGSGDQGQAIGACYLGYKDKFPNFKFVKDDNYYLGSSFNKKQIKDILLKFKNKIDFHDCSKKIYSETAKLLSKGKIVAWFQDKAEFGPRALGNRSILCKPFPNSMKDYVNKKVKFREAFRPFAPAIISEYQNDYFSIKKNSYHMLFASKVKKNKIKEIGATVHVDNTSRVQTVSKESNLKFYKLLSEFHRITNIPVLLNTSFNVKGQPIINNPKEAIHSLLTTKIDYLVINNYLIKKKKS